MSRYKYYTGSFIWVFVARLSDAIIKFFSIPLLLDYFGNDNYGLLVLAISTNAYMNLLDLGINTGAVKYFSQWIYEKKYGLVESVARTSISFYLVIGLINCFVLLGLAQFGKHFFNISPSQYLLLANMFYLLAIFSIINWSTSIFNQLLIADEKIKYIQVVSIIKSVLNLLFILMALKFNLSLIEYFFFTLCVNSLVLIPYYFKAKRSKLISTFLPGGDWSNFKPILSYSIAVFAMGIFQFTATQSRPVILAMFNTLGTTVLTEYRIVEVFPLFIISIGGMILTILLPKASRLVKENEEKKISEMAYRGTIFTSILVCCLCFPVMINSREILTLYVGSNYEFLAPWLKLWMLTIILYLHNSPVASMILAIGKTRPLVYSSAIACSISITVNIVLSNSIGVGSAVVGYFIYILIQMSAYYLYFNRKILNVQSMRVFKSFLVPLSVAFLAWVPVYWINIPHIPELHDIVIKSLVWLILFLSVLAICRVVTFKDIHIFGFKKMI